MSSLLLKRKRLKADGAHHQRLRPTTPWFALGQGLGRQASTLQSAKRLKQAIHTAFSTFSAHHGQGSSSPSSTSSVLSSIKVNHHNKEEVDESEEERVHGTPNEQPPCESDQNSKSSGTSSKKNSPMKALQSRLNDLLTVNDWDGLAEFVRLQRVHFPPGHFYRQIPSSAPQQETQEGLVGRLLEAGDFLTADEFMGYLGHYPKQYARHALRFIQASGLAEHADKFRTEGVTDEISSELQQKFRDPSNAVRAFKLLNMMCENHEVPATELHAMTSVGLYLLCNFIPAEKIFTLVTQSREFRERLDAKGFALLVSAAMTSSDLAGDKMTQILSLLRVGGVLNPPPALLAARTSFIQDLSSSRDLFSLHLARLMVDDYKLAAQHPELVAPDFLKIPREVHTLLLSSDMVLSPSVFDLLHTQLSTSAVVGLDMEHPPVFKSHQRIRPALLQLATKDYIFLIDLFRPPPDPAWLASVLECLANPRVMKLGVGVERDIQLLSNERSFSHSLGKNAQINLANVVDLSDFYRIWFPVKSPHSHAISLKRLVATCLGSQLNKAQQMSNWSRRPLTSHQRHYAALDAYVSILLFDYFTSLNPEINAENFEQVRHRMTSNAIDPRTILRKEVFKKF